jgi:diguanylate cyclase (GGDEF)-like protein
VTDFSEPALEQRRPDNERDELTATLSRQAFVLRLAARVERALRERAVFGLCVLDLDHFKNINLSHGPTCGDDALRDIAQRLVRTISGAVDGESEATVARYDGNAFAVLIETDSPQELCTAAEALREAVAAEGSPTGSGLSASVGAVLARIGEPVDALLVRAEQTLYLAKQFGRNRVEIGNSPTPLRDSSSVVALRRSA